MNVWFSIALYGLLVAFAVYFFMILPGKKRNKKQRNLHESLQVGDEVITISGVVGTVESIEDDIVTLRICETATMRVLIIAIQTLKKKALPDPEE